IRVGRSRRVTRRGSTSASNASHMMTTTQRAPAAAISEPIIASPSSHLDVAAGAGASQSAFGEQADQNLVLHSPHRTRCLSRSDGVVRVNGAGVVAPLSGGVPLELCATDRRPSWL